jgi:hypothetical protein
MRSAGAGAGFDSDFTAAGPDLVSGALEHPLRMNKTARMANATFCIPTPFFYTQTVMQAG